MMDTLLAKAQKSHRWVAIAAAVSLVIMIAALIALLKRWAYSFDLIAVACAFSLITVNLSRSAYRRAFMESSSMAAASRVLADCAFQEKEKESNVSIAALGLAPDVPFTRHPAMRKIVRGTYRMKHKSRDVMIAETAFLRTFNGKPRSMDQAVSGTLITSEGVLDAGERWLLLHCKPYDGIFVKQEFESEGMQVTPLPEGLEPADYVLITPQGAGSLPEWVIDAVRSKAPKEAPFALAARNGTLSLVMQRCFYAYKNANMAKPTAEDLNRRSIPGLEMYVRLLDKAR